MYHRVIPLDEAKKGVQAGMYVEPEIFGRHIQFLKRYFSIVPIFELPFHHKKSSRVLHQKPLCVLTFDDGWYDFHTYAFPILKEHQVPATVFLPTDFIGTEDWFWTDRLASVFYQRENSKRYDNIDQGVRNPLVSKLLNLKGSPESRMEGAIELLKTHTGEEIERAIKELTSRWKLEPDLPGRAFLSWEETRQIAQAGLITFGSHTASHRILTTLEKAEIEGELTKAREKLIAEKLVNPAFIPFSYPNGNYNHRIARIVKDIGYSLAVTTEHGWNHNESDPFALRRVSIHNDMTSTQAMFGCRLVGIF